MSSSKQVETLCSTFILLSIIWHNVCLPDDLIKTGQRESRGLSMINERFHMSSSVCGFEVNPIQYSTKCLIMNGWEVARSNKPIACIGRGRVTRVCTGDLGQWNLNQDTAIMCRSLFVNIWQAVLGCELLRYTTDGITVSRLHYVWTDRSSKRVPWVSGRQTSEIWKFSWFKRCQLHKVSFNSLKPSDAYMPR